jgi:hypothetical protein
MPSWAHDDVQDRSLLKDKNGNELPVLKYSVNWYDGMIELCYSAPSTLEIFLKTFQPFIGDGISPGMYR